MRKLFFDKLTPKEQAAVAWEADRSIKAHLAALERSDDPLDVLEAKRSNACKEQETENVREHIAIDRDKVDSAVAAYKQALKDTFEVGHKKGRSK